MSNVEDFLRYRNDAVAMFPVLSKYALIETDSGSAEFRGLNVAGIPTYNVPPSFDMNANQVTYRTGYHEPGHEYDAWLTKNGADHHAAFLKFFGIAGDWETYKKYSATLEYPMSWYEDPGEMWADAFADAVAGDIKVCLRHSQLHTPDPKALREFFLSYLPAQTPQPEIPPVSSPAYRKMYDSVYAANIPADAQVVAGYVDGTYAWSAQDWARFSGKTLVRICVWNNTYGADVIDVEGGNNDANGAVPWVKAKWERGETPTVYCYSDAGPEGYRVSDVRAACDAAGVKRPLIWITRAGDGSSFDPTGDTEIVALQYEFDGAYDVSVIANDWPRENITNTTGDTGITYLTKADFDKFVADTNNTIEAIKARLAIDAHHTHSTSEPIETK